MNKKIVSVLLTGASLISIDLTAQDFDRPDAYMQYISQQQQNVTRKFLSYNSAVSHGKRARKVEKLREQLLDEVNESKMNIGGMPKFKGDGAYRDSSVAFMKFYYNVLNDDYAKIVNMEEIAQQSYDEMEAFLMLQEQVDQKMEEANERIKVAQKKFAEQNNVRLIESKDEMSEKMKVVSEVNEHYHAVYLLFFKPYLQEQNLAKAIEKANVGGIEQDKNALLKYCLEAETKLESVKPYNGDNSIKAACKQMLQYYKKEVNDYLKPITDFLLVKERFETIKKEYEKKSEPTKEDVNAYNKAVNDINTAAKKYNEATQNMNQAQNEALNNWNKSIETFFDEHMPR